MERKKVSEIFRVVERLVDSKETQDVVLVVVVMKFSSKITLVKHIEKLASFFQVVGLIVVEKIQNKFAFQKSLLSRQTKHQFLPL